MSNLEIIKTLYKAFAERDTDTILKLFDQNIEWIQNEGFPGGGRHIGPDAVLNDVFAKFRVHWQVWKADVEEYLDAGDAIVALGKYHGTHKTSGKSMTAAFAHVYRIREGKIVKFEQYTDTLKIAEAMKDENEGGA